MKTLVDKLRIIRLKEKGHSNRSVAKMTACNRKTVAKYWNEHLQYTSQLFSENADSKTIQEKITQTPKYNSVNRKRRKLTDDILFRLHEILDAEKKKDKVLGCHKQQLTKKQIHEKLISEGFNISLSTINHQINEIRKASKECFIRQEYNYGDRLEYDFGEVKLVIGGKVKTYYMAVLSSPGGNFHWAYLYTNQKKQVFMDSHVEFFQMMGGVYREVVYDNMRNVVAKFLGRNEKELNPDLLKLSVYYGFEINVTNCFSGNEKGYVESSVKILRNQIFAKNYEFNSLDDAKSYLESSLIKLNENSKVAEEREHLLPYKPKLELAEISENTVNSYSFICVDNNFYSVPEYLVSKTVVVKSYYDEIHIYSGGQKACKHKRLEGFKQMSVDIFHYLDTLRKKPGAIRNSLALSSIPELKILFDEYYRTRSRKFIEIFMANKDRSIPDILMIMRDAAGLTALEIAKSSKNLELATRSQLMHYN